MTIPNVPLPEIELDEIAQQIRRGLLVDRGVPAGLAMNAENEAHVADLEHAVARLQATLGYARILLDPVDVRRLEGFEDGWTEGRKQS